MELIENSFFDGLGSPLVIASHTRSGTHLTLDFVRRQFPSFRSWKWPGEANDMLYLSIDVLSVIEANWGDARARQILCRPVRPLIKTHWTDSQLLKLREKQPHFAQFLAQKAAFVHVVRHPLRVLESLWAFEASHVTGADQKLNRLWLERKVAYWVQHTEDWMMRTGVIRIRFEDILGDPSAVLNCLEGVLLEDAQRLSPLLPTRLRGLWHSRRNRLLSIRPASTEILVAKQTAAFRYLFEDAARNILSEKAKILMQELKYE